MVDERLAIDGGSPLFTGDFPTWPIYDEREEQALINVLRSGHWGMLSGEQVHTFEQQFAAFQHADYGVAVPNGTLALELALRALGIGEGDEVITTPYTFVATVTAILTVGAYPVFADIDLDTYTIDPQRVEAAITDRTRAIIPVHIAGQPADMGRMMAIARAHNLHVVEDACQAWGASWRSQRVGAIGDLGAFSFQSSKNITAGEGGIVLTNNPELAELCWSIHNVGRIRTGAWYQHEILGSNLRMTEWQGAVLQVQLARLPDHMATREANARYLSEALSTVDGLTPLPLNPDVTEHARHLFVIRYDPDHFGGRSRDAFLAAWQAEGITAIGAGYVPLNHTPAVVNTLRERSGAGDIAACPAAEHASGHTLWLEQTVLLGGRVLLDAVVAAAQKIQRAWH